MGDILNRAAVVRAPNDGDSGTNGDAMVRKFLCDTGSSANALPAAMGNSTGRYLEIANLGANAVYYYFSIRSAAAATVGVTPTSAGVSAGKYLGPGEVCQKKLPQRSDLATWHFVRKTAAGSTTVEISLAECR